MGSEMCIRDSTSIGLIVVSARTREQDKVRALNLGADDYLTKPFGVDELLARMTATLRRSRPAEDVNLATEIVIGHLRIDFEAYAVFVDDELVQLTPTEFALLEVLVRNAGRLLSYEELLRNVWGRGYENSREYVRVYAGRLRNKIERPAHPAMIITEPRAGYRLVAPNSTQA